MASSDTMVVSTSSILSKVTTPIIGSTNDIANNMVCSITELVDPIHFVTLAAPASIIFLCRSLMSIVMAFMARS